MSNRPVIYPSLLPPLRLKIHYRYRDHEFIFRFVKTPERDHFVIECLKHPGFNGQDSDPHKTHLYRNNTICFISGREPKTLQRCKELAGQWAKYFVEYRETGIAQQ